MTQVSRTGKNLLNLSPEGCPGCKHLRSFASGQAMCTLYMDYPTDDDLKIGCPYRLPMTSKSQYKRLKVQNESG